ncbi:hypothetical protein SM080_001714 [Cronobacter sakazakii]|uniref:hypothetical protein n=1 Tax=Cronobacter sakazakii TaxID=28141 RepID=UPI000CFA99C1|nr:hypothetical protein [Cronobacter sakazakii]EGT4510858.1 hypothetical protein [Cronobacter sakazakii]ELY4345504.1 hypothetical protein [Cronobacter sakazakii]ELY4759215.1 hypothetical protein [Cronobacter sakazakii]ELY6298758.1 hypothetical protein [Cronobacter sakazakii]ELY6339746.1 hypothetical protein [Cronobacter sakazakii]
MTTEYTLPLDDAQASSLPAIAEILRANAGLFKHLVMSEHPDDIRYAYQPESFEITDITDRTFTFRCLVHYFEPCCDRDMHDARTYTIPYQVRDNTLAFALDETPWVVA